MSDQPEPVAPPTRFHRLDRFYVHLRTYFLSGWAFLLPYALVFGIGLVASCLFEKANEPIQHYTADAFRLLHLLHAGLILSLLFPRSGLRRSSFFCWSCVPWIALSVVIGIPGAYLEFPADPWEHLSRIIEWTSSDSLLEHRSPLKSGYLIAATLTSWAHPDLRIHLLGLLGAGAGLLLAYQFYRLSLACNINRRWAIVGAVLYVVFLGNNTFNFVRYYSLSTSVLAQIAMLAFLRVLILNYASDQSRRQLTPTPNSIISLVTSGLIMALNHPQAIAICAICLGAITLRLAITRLRISLPLIALFFAITGALAVEYMPKHPSLDAATQATWMNIWFGFDLLDVTSPASERAWSIIGAAGVASTVGALVLVRHNHPAAWLTLAPLVALMWPPTSLVLANILLDRGPASTHLITFHRMLLGLPVGLTLVAIADRIERWYAIRPLEPQRPRPGSIHLQHASIRAATGVLAIALALSAPISAGMASRLWHLCSIPARDLQMKHLRSLSWRMQHTVQGRVIVAGAANSWVLFGTGQKHLFQATRLYYWPDQTSPSAATHSAMKTLEARSASMQQFILLVDNSPNSIAPHSQAAFLSQHWLPQEVSLASTGAIEIKAYADELADRGILTPVPTGEGSPYSVYSALPSIQRPTP